MLSILESSRDGLTSHDALERLAKHGPNAVRSHGARALAVLLRQFKSALLLLLLVAAIISFFVGERTDAAIILAIMSMSVGLGFGNEYRAGEPSQPSIPASAIPPSPSEMAGQPMSTS